MDANEKVKLTGEAGPLRIAVIGAGIGGLTFTQLLRNNQNFSVTVYERGPRDEEISSLTGFRILLAKDMLADMRARIEPSVTVLLEKAVGRQPLGGQSIALLDEKGDVKVAFTPKEFRDASSVSRWKLRAALLEGLEGVIRWRTEFQSYERLHNGAVKLHFKGGRTAECDLLVGADGAGSKVRKQLVPDSKRDSLGITVVYFKMPLTPETELMMPFGSGCMIMAPRSSMVVSYYQDRAIPYGPYTLESIDPEGSYLMCGLGCYTDDYIARGKHSDSLSPEEIKATWLARTRHWHPLLRSLIAMTVPNSIYVANVKTQHPFGPWKSGNVTLLGDAAHSMTPYLGKGATAAIADALSLAEHLEGLPPGDRGQLPVILDHYSVGMLKAGFHMAKQSKMVHKVVFMGSNAFTAWLRNTCLKLLAVYLWLIAKKEVLGKWLVVVAILLYFTGTYAVSFLDLDSMVSGAS